MILTVSDRNLKKLNQGNYTNRWESRFQPGMFEIEVNKRKQGTVLNKLGRLYPVKKQTLKEMEKYRNKNFVALKDHRGRFKYVLKVQPNASTYLVNVGTHAVQKVNLNRAFTLQQRKKINLNGFLKKELDRVRIKKVNYVNKSDPVSLHNFKPKEYAFRVKTGPVYHYYQPSTIRTLMGTSPNRLPLDESVFINPMTRRPVHGRNISKVRMVKPHKVRTV